jgi:hypothetical protein
MPWDMVVFLTITTAGFGVSLKRLAYPELDKSAQPQLERSVASLGTASRDSMLDLGCLETLTRNNNRSTNDRTVRIKGQLCYSGNSKSRYFDNISVRNLTTGNESTVFFQNGDRSFLTDAMLLQPGKNVIQVTWKENPKDNEHVVVTEFFGR